MVGDAFMEVLIAFFAALPVGLAQLHAERGPGGASQVRSLQILKLSSPIASSRNISEWYIARTKHPKFIVVQFVFFFFFSASSHFHLSTVPTIYVCLEILVHCPNKHPSIQAVHYFRTALQCRPTTVDSRSIYLQARDSKGRGSRSLFVSLSVSCCWT